MPPATPMFQAHDYWSGYNLNVPGGGQEELLKAQAGERKPFSSPPVGRLRLGQPAGFPRLN